MPQDNNIRIGITQGDINGIGLEVIVKALSNRDILEIFTPVIFGSSRLLTSTADALGVEDFQIQTIASADEAISGIVNVVDTMGPDASNTPGVASPHGGKAAADALEAASRAIEEGAIDLLVTAPIDKNAIQGDAFRFPGHTEYLEDKFAVGGGKAMMIMAAGNLRVALVTTHMALSDVPRHITKDSVKEAIKSFNRALKMDFGCERPKIAVLSLNPHCSDGGVMGSEEADSIIPAIEECKQEGVLAFGPIAADGLFGSGAYMKFDGVLAMYHDQGLAPFKAIAGGAGVNFTAGLDIIRTSPAHGTAYDKAGKDQADETSMREAIYAAIDIARRRDSYLEFSENPLEIRNPAQRSSKRQKDKINEPDADAVASAESTED